MKNKIRSYKESYLSDSMPNLGDFFDFAIHAHGKSSEDVWQEFATSWLAVEYGRGSPKYVAGLSGLELYYALYKTDDWDIASKAAKSLRLNTPEFWCGWILAYYQWAYNMTFKTIQSRLPFASSISALIPSLMVRPKTQSCLHCHIDSSA
ncbi:MAG: hypothetical protein FWD58_02100 [Firmicutes bacterium]|nr:hypothetical protein [Bacillota bacterium]